MKKSLILPSICIFAGIALTVISFIVLPNNVVTQFSIGGGGVTTTPKILAVAISAVIAIGGGLATGWLAAALVEGLLQAIRRGYIRARGNRRRR